MKKYTWIVALLAALAFAFAFVTCDDGDSSKKKTGSGDDNPTVELTGEEIVITAVGNQASSIVIDKNTFAVEDVASGSIGFLYEFPEAVKGKGYGSVIVELELLGPATGMTPDFIAFNPKADKDMKINLEIVGHTQEYHGELKIGKITDKAVDAKCDGDVCLQYEAGSCVVGAKGSAEYPMKKLTNGLIVFQFNSYAGDITTAGWSKTDGKATFKIAVTKITFPGGAAVDNTPDVVEPNAEVDPAAFNAAVGIAITQEWGNTGAIVFDSTTNILTRTSGSSSLFSLTPPAGITETNTVKITYIAIATVGEVKLTVKQNGGSTDVDPAMYPTLKGDGTQGVLEIPGANYKTSGTWAVPTKLSFQDNSGTDAEWKMKIISVTVE